jgi:Late competence development protein ComFB
MGIYKNVMELLVEEEVIKQFKQLSPRVAAYVNPVEWIAHALNQLPPLYATSEKGLHHQAQRGRTKHGAEIKQAVQRALAAIRRDPLRSSVPLHSPHGPGAEILSQLRFLLHNEQLEWESVPLAIEQALEQASQGKAWQTTAPPHSPSLYPSLRNSSPFPQYPTVADVMSNKPQTQPSRTSAPANKPTRQKPAAPAQNDTFGWDDPLYNPR